MPIDPSIALGVRPVEQPNVLGQMAQAMAMRQAQQEYENEGGLRNALTGGLPEDPSSLLKYGKSGRAVYESALKGRKEQLESDDKRNTMLGGFAGFVMDNPTPANFESTLTRAVNYKLMTEAKKQELLAQYGGSPESIKSYATQIFQSAISAQAQQSNTTSQANARMTSGPGYLQAGIAREKLTQDQAELARVRGILTGGATTPTAPPVAGNAPMGGGGGRLGSGTFNIPMGGGAQPPVTGAVTQPNVLATQVAPPTTTNVNASNPNVPSRVNEITRQLTQLAKVGGPVANQAMEGLVKEYNVLNPAGKIEMDLNGVFRTINERSGVATVVTGADGKPVMGKVAPITKDVLDPTDPAEKRMITVDANTYVQGTGLGADGKGAAPKGVLGVAGSPLQPNYMRDPKNPLGVIPVPGSDADPNAKLQIGYRQRTDGTGQEFIPGGPADPKVIANRTTVTLSAKDKEAREAKYPQATSALKAFNAKTDKFDSVITELLANEKGLNEITGFFAGRTDLSAMSKEARRAFALFNTITAKGGFSELQDMRNASPTGGALGNVSNQEGGQLIASFGALTRTQDGDDVRKSLTTAQNDLRNLKERMGEAYDLTYEYRKPADGGFIYLGKE